MHHLSFSEQPSYPVCLLVQDIRKDDIHKEYIQSGSLPKQDVMVLSLHRSEGKKKTPVAEIKAYIEQELVPTWQDLGTQYILCSDPEYFKQLTKAVKAEANLGYVMDCAYGDWKVIYVPNYRAVFYDPERVRSRIRQGLEALSEHRSGQYRDPGNEIIKFEEYPRTTDEIEQWLIRLLEMDVPLAIDIEAFSLKHHSAGIGTISFAWSKHEGIAFPVDYQEIIGATEAPFGRQIRNEPVRDLLRQFFKLLTQKAYYHSISYDVYVLIYQLFMKDILDTEGLLEGMEIMLRNWEDTKLITYLATNSCAGNRLGLKIQAQEFAGNYAMDDEGMQDITKIPLPKLLRYNLVDGLSTHYVFDKRYPQMVRDDQLDIYETIFKPAILDIIQMQLTGMPVNMKRVEEVGEILHRDQQSAVDRMKATKTVQEFTDRLNENWVIKRNEKLKVKRVTLADAKEEFNPKSSNQLQALLFEMLGLPVIGLTDSKLPSTDGETIAALLNHVSDPDVKEFLEGLQLFNIVTVLIDNFLPSLLSAVKAPDGWHYLFGNFNLGGTLSGRLSSSGPNLQNLPSTGKGHPIKGYYAKLIKTCFEAPPGWLFGGIDFSSLEDRISALTTKDPNKLKVYTDGYDGHSLRAYAYFGDQMPDIVDTVDSINSIAKKYKPFRDRSKNPTFTLTYQGTYHALMKKYGFSKEQALDVEAKYHDLYKVSDDWVFKQLDEATQTGYITAAFGLRLRTPLLKQVVRGTSKTPYEAEAEGRTAGNALGQSWCLLNSRAGSEFMGKVRKSDFRLKIRPIAQIHDAGYFLIKDEIKALAYTNEHLVKAVEWQEHPDIWHEDVKLGGELSIFFPSWKDECIIPNHATEEEIFAKIDEHVVSLQT